MPTTTNLNTLKINYLTQAQYEAALANEQINENEIYLTPSLEAESAPIGAIQSYAGSTAPRGWLICDGSAILRTAYSELFEVIGTTYGAGDGSTTFNLPDLRGRAPIGSGLGTATDATERTLGQSGGSERVTLSVEQMPSHSHSFTMWKSGAHYYPSASSVTYEWYSSAYGSGTVTPPSTGGGQSHGNMQPYLTINYIIKAKDFRVPYIPQTDSTSILNFFYPVGSYYRTSDTAFNPNTAWGGTWELEDDYELVAWISVNNNAVVASKNLSASGLGGIGVYTLTFTKPMANTDYIVTVSGEADGTAQEIFGIYGRTKTQFLFDHANYAGTAVTVSIFTISVFGRLSEPESYKWRRVS